MIFKLTKMSKANRQIDRPLFYIIFALIIFGLIMIASAGIAYSRTRFGDPYFFFKHQFFYGVVPGLFVLFLTQKINYAFWKTISLFLFATSVILLILVFVPGFGTKIYGANRWLQLGSFSFQPSEMLKLTLVIYLSAWLEGKIEKIRDFYDGLVPFVIIVCTIGFLLINQPDIGTLGVIVLISLSIFFVSGARISHLAFIGSLGLVGIIILVKTESYRMNRLLVFLHPELDPRGIGYQINQALLAIGSGGFFGKGLGHSLQKFNYLPEPVGDSIFAIIGEELGLAGAMVLVLLFMTFAMRGLKIARHAPDGFSRLMACGIVSWVIFQAVINISAICGLIPLTGIPLPFISYGGTSLIFLMAAMGILLNISKYTQKNS